MLAHVRKTNIYQIHHHHDEQLLTESGILARSSPPPQRRDRRTGPVHHHARHGRCARYRYTAYEMQTGPHSRSCSALKLQLKLQLVPTIAPRRRGRDFQHPVAARPPDESLPLQLRATRSALLLRDRASVAARVAHCCPLGPHHRRRLDADDRRNPRETLPVIEPDSADLHFHAF